MSTVRALPLSRPIAPRRHLRPVSSTSTQVRRNLQVRTLSNVQVQPRLARKALIGIVVVLLGNLFAQVLVNQAQYSISSLKIQSKSLAIETQIVQQQVDSLRSPQNLANSARSLGMIVNSNPVFLKVASGKVLGSAVPASLSSSSAVSSNLIANSALIAKSNPQRAPKQSFSIPKVKMTTVTSVKVNQTKVAQVVLPSGGIPASPTH